MRVSHLLAPLALAALVATASAQSPTSLPGTTFAYRVLEGSAPFAGSGYFVFAPGNSSSSYNIFAISGGVSSSGTYSYSKTGAETGLLRLFSDTALGNVTGTLSQPTVNTGDAVLLEGTAGPGMQFSSYTFSNMAVPTVVTGRTFFCTIADGFTPLADEGTYRLDFTTATDYTITGLTGAAFDTAGTYTYERPNVSLGRVNMNDGITGLGSMFYGFTAPNAGWIAVSNTLGGFQIATFTSVNRPASVSASKGTSTNSIDLTWTPQPGATSYEISRRISGSFEPPMPLATVTGTTYSDRTAEPGTQYVYTLVSVCASGLSLPSAPSTTSTGWRNIGAPTSLSASDGTLTNSVQLTWPVVTYATSYNVYRSQPNTGFVLIGSAGATTYLDLTAAVGTLYTYKVVPVSVGESKSGVTDKGWRNAAAPTGLAASDGTSRTCVAVTWGRSAGVSRYKVYRAKSGSALALLASTGSNAYIDQTAAAGTVYTYAVRASTLAGDSAMSDTDTGWRANPGGGGGVIPGGGGQTGLSIVASATNDGDRSNANLATPIDALDPARQWPCGSAPQQAWEAAIEAGSRDLDRNGEPDLCQHARGDLDLSGSVDGSDVGLLLTVFGDERAALGDLTEDGLVDGADLRALLELVGGR